MTERDPIALVIFLALLVIAATVEAWHWRRRIPGEAREREPVIDVEIAAPRCACCDAEAEAPGVVIVRSEDGVDFVRRAFGAPPRYRVEGRGDVAVYCTPHGALAEQIARAELAAVERDRQVALQNVEARLAAFERVGLAEKLKELTR